jgi:short-subunit dehydrogenase
MELAESGFSVALAARREAPLSELAGELRRRFGVETRVLAVDLAHAEACAELEAATRALDLGLVVYNAAFCARGPFLAVSAEDHLRELDVNCRGPVLLAHGFGRRLVTRGRGAIILMSSLSGLQGTALLSNYAATKAFNAVLAEGLWEELRSEGVDVLSCLAGATRTPNFVRSQRPDGEPSLRAMDPAQVAREALARLGKGPSSTPGLLNRAAALAMRLLPRQRAIAIISDATRRMYGER